MRVDYALHERCEMTPKEFAHATMLVASLRTRLAHSNALKAAVTTERDDLAKQLAAHVESLRLSNAQCGEYLRQNEQLRADVAAAAEDLTRDISTLVDAGAAEYNKLHSELVEVRAALASVTEQRDSLKRTLDEWERADTKPHERVTADDVADHVVPPVLPICMTCHGCGSVLYPSPAGDYFGCGDVRCTRSNTKHWHPGCTIGPYAGPCKSATPVRHE